jgi:hypothetical protein
LWYNLTNHNQQNRQGHSYTPRFLYPSGQPAILLKFQEKHDKQIADF